MSYQNVEFALIKAVNNTVNRTNERTLRHFKTHEEMVGFLEEMRHQAALK